MGIRTLMPGYSGSNAFGTLTMQFIGNYAGNMLTLNPSATLKYRLADCRTRRWAAWERGSTMTRWCCNRPTGFSGGVSLAGNVSISAQSGFGAGWYQLISYNPVSPITNTLGGLTFNSDPAGYNYTVVVGNGAVDLDVTSQVALNTSQLSLPGTALTLNMHVGDALTTGSAPDAHVTNSDTASSGTFTATGAGLAFTAVSATNITVAKNGATATVNWGWANTTTSGTRTASIAIANSANSSGDTGAHTQSVSGGVFAYADPSFTTSSISAGNYHVGSNGTG